MTVRRFSLAVGIAMLCAGLARASAISYDTFNIDFFAENGSWNSDATFDVTSSSADESTSGFTRNQFCPDHDWWKCICDPGIKFTVPDQPPPTPFDGSTTITLSSEGTFDADFINVGPNIKSVLFTTTDFNPDETYTCSSEYNNNPELRFFRFCGFEITGDAPTLNILFTDPIAPITSATPEPSQDVLLLIALGAVAIVQRRRARRSNG